MPRSIAVAPLPVCVPDEESIIFADKIVSAVIFRINAAYLFIVLLASYVNNIYM